MNLPGFAAEASVYRTQRVYRGYNGTGFVTPFPASVFAAYSPGPQTQASCNKCVQACSDFDDACNTAAYALLLGCLWPPACPDAAAASDAMRDMCDATNLACKIACEAFTCCPKLCGFPDPTNPGSGCCDHGEHCVDSSDQNARDGCCPSDRRVCGGKCCADREGCCGDTCCPLNFPCTDGVCGVFPPFGNAPLPPPPLSRCAFGHVPCGGQCCPPGKQCCIPGGSGLPLGCYEPYDCIA